MSLPSNVLAFGARVVVQGLSPACTYKAWRRDLPLLTQAAINATRTVRTALTEPDVLTWRKVMVAEKPMVTNQTLERSAS